MNTHARPLPDLSRDTPDITPVGAADRQPLDPTQATGALGVSLLAAQAEMPDLLETVGFAALSRAMEIVPDPRLVRYDRAGFTLPEASGRVEGGQIVLHPDRVRARLPQTRSLIAHELAHLAQMRLPGDDFALLDAEIEAREIATRVEAGLVPLRPRVAVSPVPVLHDKSFTDQVGARYAQELSRIRRLLKGWLGFLWVTDAAIREAFTLVESLPFAVVQGLMWKLTPDQQEVFLDNVSPGHFPRFRPGFLALFSVARDTVLAGFDEDLFDGMSFDQMKPEEVVALNAGLENGFPDKALEALKADEARGAQVAALVSPEVRKKAARGYDRTSAEGVALKQIKTDAKTRDARVRDADKDPDGRAAVKEITALMKTPDKANRIAALDRFSTFLGRDAILQGVVQSIDRAGLLDPILDDYPRRALLSPAQGPAGRQGPKYRRIETFLRVAALRPPWKNVLLAEKLLDSGFFNVLTSSEAFLAFQLVKTLPDEVRTGFLSDKLPPGLFGESATSVEGAIYGALSQSMREGAGLTLYRGGAGKLDLASIQTQLLDDALWDKAHAGRLSGLIRMAGAAGEAEWVFNRARDVAKSRPGAYGNADFQERIVAPFMLYGSLGADGKRRNTWQPQYGKWAIENWGQRFGATFGAMGDAFRLVADSNNSGRLVANALLGHSLGGEGISALALQDLMGGAFMGIRFTAPEDLEPGSAERRTLETAIKAEQGLNFIDRVYWDRGRGVLELEAKALSIAAIRYPLGDVLFSAGKGKVAGLKVNLAYDSARKRRGTPTNLDLRMARLELGDLLIVQRESMLSINRLDMGDLEVDLGRDAIADKHAQARTGLNPWNFNPVTPILKAVELATGGIATPVSRMTDALVAPAQATPLMLRIGSMKLTGLQTSGGQYFGEIGLENLQVGVAGSLDDYLEILRQSAQATADQRARLVKDLPEAGTAQARTKLGLRISRLKQRQDGLEALVTSLENARKTLDRLRKRKDLSKAERKARDSAQKLLEPYLKGGITVDAGRAWLKGAQGALTVGDLEFGDLHGRGQSSAGLLSFLTSSEALNRIAQGNDHRNVLMVGDSRGPAKLTVELGDITIDKLRLRSGIPTIEAAQKADAKARAALKERDWDPVLKEAATRAANRLEATQTYHELAASGVSYLSAGQVRDLRAAHAFLTSGEALYIHHLDASQARLGVDADRGTVTFGAERFQATGQQGVKGRAGAAIRAGDLSIRAARGRNLELDVGVKGGLLQTGDLVNRLSRAGIKADFLRAEGIAHTTSSVGVGSLEASKLDALLRAEDWSLAVKAGRIGVTDFRARITREWLDAQIKALEDKGARRGAADDKRLARLREARIYLADYKAAIKDLQSKIAAATDPDERKKLESLLTDTVTLFHLWETRVGARSGEVKDLDVTVSRTGNIARTGFDFAQAARDGITIQGHGKSGKTGRTDRLFSSASMQDARFGDTTVGRVALGETSGKVYYSEERIELTDFRVEKTELENIVMTSHSVMKDKIGGTAVTQIYASGLTTLTSLDLTACLAFVPDPRNPGQMRLEKVTIPKLDIGRIDAGILGYAADIHRPKGKGKDEASDYSVSDGALIGVKVRNLTVDMPDTEKEKIKVTGGTLDLAKVENLRAWGFIHGLLQLGSARLNGTSLRVEFLETGGQRIDIGKRNEGPDGRVRYEGGLRADQGRVQSRHGSARFATGMLTGRIVNDGEITKLEHLRMGSFTLQSCALRFGDKKIVAHKPVNLKDIRIDARIDRNDKKNTKVDLTALHVESITGEDLTVTKPPYTVRIRQDKDLLENGRWTGKPVLPPLSIRGLDVSGMRWSTKGGITAMPGRKEANIDVAQAHAAFDLFTDGRSMDLDVVVDADKVDFDFLRDGTQQMQIKDLDASFKGKAAKGVRIDARIDDLATGKVTIDGRRISVPDLSLPTLTVESLDYDTPDMRVQVDGYNSRAVMTGTTASFVLDMAEEDDKVPFRKLAITRLVVPKTVVTNLKVTFPNKYRDDTGTMQDIVVTIPSQYGAELNGLRIEPREGEEAFTIEPRPGETGKPGKTALSGHVHLATVKSPEMGVDIGSQISASSKVALKTFDLDFFSTGGMKGKLEELVLSDTLARFGKHVLRMNSSASKHGLHGQASLKGITFDDAGNVSFDSAALQGFVYDNSALGVKLDIKTATIPKPLDPTTGEPKGIPGFNKTDAGLVVIPEIEVNEAWFKARDLGKSKPGGSGSKSGRSVLQNKDFLDGLHGSVGVTLNVDWLPRDRLVFPIKHGKIDLDDVENQLYSDGAVDFDLEDGNRLVLNLDYGNLIGLIPAMIPQANKELVAFKLKEQDEIDEAKKRKLRMSTAATRIETGGGGGSSSEPPIALEDFNVNLKLEPTEVDLGAMGAILLGGHGKDGALGIKITGDLRRKYHGLSQLDIAVEKINMALDPTRPLTFGSLGKGQSQTRLYSADVTIDKVKDTHLRFDGLFSPDWVEGTVEKATIRNVILTNQKGKKP